MPVSDDGLQARMFAAEVPRPAETAEYGRLQARVEQLEQSNEWLQIALSGVREREDAVRREIAESVAREGAISQRLATIEERHTAGDLNAAAAGSTAAEALAAGTRPIGNSRLPLPAKVEMIQERLGLTIGSGSLVSAVMEASAVAGVPNDGAPLVAQVERLMVKLFGEWVGDM